MEIQVRHFRGGFGITPNEGSAISAFYSATCTLVVWLGSHGSARPAQHFSDAWAPGLDLTSPDSWHAPVLQALSTSHALLLQDYGCVEWTSESDRVPAPLVVSIALPFVRPSVCSRNSPPPLSTVTLSQLRMLFQSTHENCQGAEAPAEPGERIAKSSVQRTLTAHVMGRWAKHEGVLAHISLKRSVEMLELQCAQRFPARPADPISTIFAELFPAPQPEASQLNAPTEKARQMHINWNPLGFLSDLSAHKIEIRFPPDVWQAFFCRSFGAPIHKMLAHAQSRTLCSCKMGINPLGDHVLTCKQHTGSIRGHNHLMDVVACLLRDSKIVPVRVNHKVSTTGDGTRKQGLVTDVYFVCEFKGSSRASGG